MARVPIIRLGEVLIATVQEELYDHDALQLQEDLGQLVCDGVDCTYCTPSNPLPVCAANSHCTPQADTTSVCSYPTGNGTTGAACATLADCAGPYTCIDTGFGQQCRAWCQVAASGCGGGQTCMSLAVKVFTGGTEWGVCL